MNSSILMGIILIVFGIIVFALAETVIVLKIKKFNREWMEGAEDNEMS